MAYQTEIISSQPQGITTTYTVTVGGQNSWNTDICDCCTDMKVCLCGTFCPCILACQVAKDFGECCCLPYVPGTLVALRTGVRERYRIEGSICCDWVAMVCIPPCALCQLARELKSRN
ncbi:cornifelin homolog A-like [Rhinatrema bivittatum]|uniref:cornifelin homolog A-like n=1 Tax=Rhinatrema bivittatum TaxID=194408 RepID=UPI00112AB207|nr:cornifelin homolog A-like [Rhinatrema bivittatum]XP_029433416.1 cornifelin homolog A-like [Rhinatrema bivittatum]